jgi:hypothetical protein
MLGGVPSEQRTLCFVVALTAFPSTAVAEARRCPNQHRALSAHLDILPPTISVMPKIKLEIAASETMMLAVS